MQEEKENEEALKYAEATMKSKQPKKRRYSAFDLKQIAAIYRERVQHEEFQLLLGKPGVAYVVDWKQRKIIEVK